MAMSSSAQGARVPAAKSPPSSSDEAVGRGASFATPIGARSLLRDHAPSSVHHSTAAVPHERAGQSVSVNSPTSAAIG
jgi:hypothetical protein